MELSEALERLKPLERLEPLELPLTLCKCSESDLEP